MSQNETAEPDVNGHVWIVRDFSGMCARCRTSKVFGNGANMKCEPGRQNGATDNER